MKRRLGLESLESRTVMDASWEFAAMDDDSLGIVTGDLVITGTSSNDRIVVMGLRNYPGDVRVLAEGKVILSQESIPSGNKIVVICDDGNDKVSVSGRLVESDDTTPINMIVFGDGGNDSIAGAAGNDILIGGDGNDTCVGGAGDDYIGQAFDGDTPLGMIAGDDGLGRDKLDGGAGNDIINGGDDNDSISGAAGDDLIRGGDGNDVISGGIGNDLIYAGSGNDRVNGDRGLDIIIGGEGADNLNGGDDEDLLVAGAVASEDTDTDTELLGHMSDWTSDPTALPFGLSTVGDDGARDSVVGGKATDVLYASIFLPPAIDPLLYDVCKPVLKELEYVLPE